MRPPDDFLSRVIAEDWGPEPRQVELVPQFLTRDPVIAIVVATLAPIAPLALTVIPAKELVERLLRMVI